MMEKLENILIEENIKHKDNDSFSIQRSYLRNQSFVNSNFRRSLQTCSIENNLTKLKAIYISTRSKHLRKTICGLLNILENLMIPADYLTKDYESSATHKIKGFMPFEQAFDMYIDIVGVSVFANERIDDIKVRFRDSLLHSEYGLKCVVYCNSRGKRYIILDTDDVDLVSFFIDEQEKDIDDNISSKLDFSFVQHALRSIDTEYDRNVVKTLLSKVLSSKDLSQLGIKPETAIKRGEKMEIIFEEISNAKVAAEDMLRLRLKGRIQKNLHDIEALDLQASKGILSEKRLKDVQLQKELLGNRLSENQKILDKDDRYSIQKFNQSTRRLAEQLIKENGFKNRKNAAGAPQLLDSEDEEFIAKAIEDKSSAHGRRHDTTLYLHHRIKSRDLLTLANYNLAKRGKRLIKSSQTVYLRARPRKVNTIEGRRHTGNIFLILHTTKYIVI